MRKSPVLLTVFLVLTLVSPGLGCGGESPTPPPASSTLRATATPVPVTTTVPPPTAAISPTPQPTLTPVSTPTSEPTPTPVPTRTPEPWVSYWPTGEARRGIATLTIAPSDGRTIYASTQEAIYRSNDGGKSWTIVSRVPNLVALAVDPVNRDTLYAYFWPRLSDSPQEPKGLRKSSDGGRSWSDPTTGASADIIGPATTLAISPSKPSVIIVGTAYYGTYGRILRSADGGASWQSTYAIDSVMGVGDVTAIAIHAASANIVYAAVSVYHGGSVIRSDDGGLSWRSTTPVPMPLSFPASLALDPNDPNVVSVAHQAPTGSGVEVYRSHDGGGSWTKASNGLPEAKAWRPLLTIDPLNPKVLFLSVQGTNAGIYRTKDAANSWAKLSPEGAPQFADVTSLGYSPREQMLYVGTNEGVWQANLSP